MNIALTGQQGEGKSAGMVFFGILFSAMFGVPLYSRNVIKGYPYTRILSLDQLRSLRDGIVLLDEFWVDADSRLSAENVKMSRFVNQGRKKHLVLIYTTQDFGQLDKRIRFATQWIIPCEKRGNGVTYTFVRGSDGRVGKRLKLADMSFLFGLYDTDEEISPLSEARTLGAATAAPQSSSKT